MRALAAIAVMAMAALLPGVSLAQGNRPGGGPGGDRPRDEAFRMIDAYIIGNLQESLGLSDDQFAHVQPLVKRQQRNRRDLAQRRMRNMQELRRALQSGTATEAGVADLLRDSKALASEEARTLARDVDAIDAVLTPIQQAKYRVFELEVERKIREMMTQMRFERRMGPRGPGRLGGDSRETRP